MANIPVDRFTEESAVFFLKEWEALITKHRHHPSIMSWCGGNEQEWGYFFEDRIVKMARQLDPSRLVVPTDGRWMSEEIREDKNYDYVSVCYVEYTDVLPLDEYADLYSRDNCGKPQVVHEMGNFTTVPSIEDLPKYKGAVNFPHKLQNWAKAVEEAGRMPVYHKAAANALAMQKLSMKLILEKARLSDAIRGYHLWTLTDYYDTTQGLLNQFYEDKAFTAKEFAALNGSSLLLWDTQRWCFVSGEQVLIRIKLSRFETADWEDARLTLTLHGEDSTEKLLTEAVFPVTVAGHGTIALSEWELMIPKIDQAQKCKLSARLTSAQGELSNDWEIWIYPRTETIIDRQGKGRELFIHYLSRHLVENNRRMVRHFTIPMPLNENLLVTGYIMDGMLEAVYQGARMLLLALPDTFTATKTRNAFKLCWWMQEEFFYINRSNNTQISNILEEHPALAQIPHESHWNLNWFHLVE